MKFVLKVGEILFFLLTRQRLPRWAIRQIGVKLKLRHMKLKKKTGLFCVPYLQAWATPYNPIEED